MQVANHRLRAHIPQRTWHTSYDRRASMSQVAIQGEWIDMSGDAGKDAMPTPCDSRAGARPPRRDRSAIARSTAIPSWTFDTSRNSSLECDQILYRLLRALSAVEQQDDAPSR